LVGSVRGLFLCRFNDFSCIRRISAPCKSPVFFSKGIFHEREAGLSPVAGLPAAQPDLVTRPDFSLLQLLAW